MALLFDDKSKGLRLYCPEGASLARFLLKTCKTGPGGGAPAACPWGGDWELALSTA